LQNALKLNSPCLACTQFHNHNNLHHTTLHTKDSHSQEFHTQSGKNDTKIQHNDDETNTSLNPKRMDPKSSGIQFTLSSLHPVHTNNNLYQTLAPTTAIPTNCTTNLEKNNTKFHHEEGRDKYKHLKQYKVNPRDPTQKANPLAADLFTQPKETHRKPKETPTQHQKGKLWITTNTNS